MVNITRQKKKKSSETIRSQTQEMKFVLEFLIDKDSDCGDLLLCSGTCVPAGEEWQTNIYISKPNITICH